MPHLLSLPTCTLKKTLLLIASLLLTALVLGFRSLRHFSDADQAALTGRVMVGGPKPLPLQLITPSANESQSARWKAQCNFYSCFEINDCVLDDHERIGVYVYPEYTFTDGNQSWDMPQSKEYQDILSAIRTSVFYQPDPSRACVLVPSLDTLNQRGMNLSLMSAMLNSLPHWNNGSNHLLFSMLAGQPPHYNQTPDFRYDRAMLATSSFHPYSYRINFDVSIPVYNTLTQSNSFADRAHKGNRNYLLIVLAQLGSDPFLIQVLHGMINERVVLLGSCEQCQPCAVKRRCVLGEKKGHQQYPDVLVSSEFCLLLPGHRLASPDLLDAMMTGCIPIFLRNDHILPFSEELDWSRASLLLWQQELPRAEELLDGISQKVRETMRQQVLYLYQRYFSSMGSVAMATIRILNSRAFPLAAPGYEWWNNMPAFSPSQQKDKFHLPFNSPYSMPTGMDLPAPPTSQGFTAVILTYNRLAMLFQTLQSVAQAPSLVKVVVVWNNVDVEPPPLEDWPAINKPLQVIKTQQNKLSNRFYPYKEIETSAVLSLDDDITMLTGDEIEFTFRAWLEHPKQIVGLPGRVHRWDSLTSQWEYESEWLNNISVVLTGAAFYHKYYHYLYTHHLPYQLRDWVDENFNGEDLLFNFMVTNYTGLPSIKTTARKRFKCANCSQENSLFSNVSHFRERGYCLNLFAQYFNRMPLKSVKYRLDPVLYKLDYENKAFANVGEL